VQERQKQGSTVLARTREKEGQHQVAKLGQATGTKVFCKEKKNAAKEGWVWWTGTERGGTEK